MSYRVPPENWKKKVKRCHSLSHPQLRKIRYFLRTVLYLKYKDEQRKIINERSKINQDESLNYEEYSRRHKQLNLKLTELNAMVDYYPIGCAVCGDRMKDLVFCPRRGGYLCDAANDMWKTFPLEDECKCEEGEEPSERCFLCGRTDENMVYNEKKGHWYRFAGDQIKDYNSFKDNG